MIIFNILLHGFQEYYVNKRLSFNNILKHRSPTFLTVSPIEENFLTIHSVLISDYFFFYNDQ